MTFIVKGSYDERLFKGDCGEEDVEYTTGDPVGNV